MLVVITESVHREFADGNGAYSQLLKSELLGIPSTSSSPLASPDRHAGRPSDLLRSPTRCPHFFLFGLLLLPLPQLLGLVCFFLFL